MIILLLGYGLVQIPKEFYKRTNYNAILESNYINSQRIEEQTMESIFELERQTLRLLKIQERHSNSQFNDYFKILLDLIPLQLV